MRTHRRTSAIAMNAPIHREANPKAGETALCCAHIDLEKGIPYGTHWHGRRNKSGEPEYFEANGPSGLVRAKWLALCDACHFTNEAAVSSLVTLQEDVTIEKMS